MLENLTRKINICGHILVLGIPKLAKRVSCSASISYEDIKVAVQTKQKLASIVV